jgi:hypothetical protein
LPDLLTLGCRFYLLCIAEIYALFIAATTELKISILRFTKLNKDDYSSVDLQTWGFISNRKTH